ncbi:MAG: hypothetical protein HQK52_19400 [Oligoflexia bacterium]|nr:hypothetical protein [Oligoflexia bacterium]
MAKFQRRQTRVINREDDTLAVETPQVEQSLPQEQIIKDEKASEAPLSQKAELPIYLSDPTQWWRENFRI